MVLGGGFACAALGEPQKAGEGRLCVPNPMGSPFPHVAHEKSETRRSAVICSGSHV